MSFDVDAFLNPMAFPEQVASSNPRAVEYMDLAVAATRRAISDTTPPRRMQYGPDPQQVIDIHDPGSAGDMARPALIFLHGGGWTSGYPFLCGFMAPAAHALGAVFLAPSYGLGPRRRYPQHLEDVLDMLGWVHANAEVLGIDVGKIVLGGHSAGGHLAALAALRRDLYPAHGLPATPFRQAFSISGSMTTCADDRPPGSVAERIYRHFLASPDDDREASPVHNVRARTMPIHLLFSEEDLERIRASNRELHEKLQNVGTETSCQELPGLDHFDTHLMLQNPGHFWWQDIATALR